MVRDSLRDIIEGSGLSFRKNSVSYILDCPRCGGDSKLYIRISDGQFVCWVCSTTDGFRGRPEYALAELLSTPVARIKEKLYGEPPHKPGIFLDPQVNEFFGSADAVDQDADEVPTIDWPGDYWDLGDPHSRRGIEYLERRGISREVAEQYGLRFCPSRRRIAFPVTLGGRLVGFQERTVLASTKIWSEELDRQFEVPKILSSKGIPREQLLMFGHRLIGQGHAVLCEGPIDAMKAHLCGGNVASMGKKVTRGQIALLRNNDISKLYLALDPDAAEETTRLVKEFADLECYLMHPPKERKDLGEMTSEEVYELFLRAPRIPIGITGLNFLYLDLKGRLVG